MKEHPILFSAPMVRAILEGRKTQTRRPVKAYCDDRGLRWMHPKTGWENWHGEWVRCPYGFTGDHLWVKETFAFSDSFDDRKPSELGNNPGIEYRSGGTNVNAEHLCGRGKWRPSIFMPRKFSRITLEVTDVRVERVQEITNADSLAEGIGFIYSYDKPEPPVDGRRRFAEIWNSIHNKRDTGWEQNPWVWVIEFKKI